MPMRPLSRLLLASITTLALIAGACVSQQKTNGREASSSVEEVPNEGGGEQAAEQPAGPALTPFTAPEGFVVSLPGEPQVQRQTVKIPAGNVATASFTTTLDGITYSASIADYPEKVIAARPAEAFLNEGRDGLVNQLKGTLKDEQAIELDGYPGKSYTVSSAVGEVKARNFLVGPRLYTLLVVFNPGIGAPAADGFLTSLKLVNPPPAIQRAGSVAADAGVDAGTAVEATPAPAEQPAAVPDAGTQRRRRGK
ncbi:hypothetical protein DRW03_25390 [Corallococcus sp. H22C18031201]|nr:hypothetical protein DRW03_25390 [Corallococcus sp. H22C18031201]